MRQRKVRNLDEKLDRVDRYYVRNPKEWKGRWMELFDESEAAPLYLELGCGKGKFLTAHAAADSAGRYIGIEGQESVVLRALEKLMGEPSEDNPGGGLSNVRLSGEFVNDLAEYFSKGELSGIYLNFSDPWPKDRHAKRRLTYRKKLLTYQKILKPGGFIEFKTDNDPLFEFTLAEIKACGMKVAACCRDLHDEEKHVGSDPAVLTDRARGFTTEYEEKFRSAGENINFVRIEV